MFIDKGIIIPVTFQLCKTAAILCAIIINTNKHCAKCIIYENSNQQLWSNKSKYPEGKIEKDNTTTVNVTSVYVVW